MEFAIIETGGKQYQVEVGKKIKIEKLPGTQKKGDTVTFDRVLVVDNGKDTTLGTPYIKGAKVEGVVEALGKGDKIRVVKYKPKSRYRKVRGHRQPYVEVVIQKLS